MIFGKESSYWTTRFAILPTKVYCKYSLSIKLIWLKSYECFSIIGILLYEICDYLKEIL